MSEVEKWTDVTPVLRRSKPIIGKREFRYPSELTLRPSQSVDHLIKLQGQSVNLRYSEVGGEPFHLSAKVEALEDGVRLFDIRPLPTPAQADMEFVRSDG